MPARRCAFGAPSTRKSRGQRVAYPNRPYADNEVLKVRPWRAAKSAPGGKSCLSHHNPKGAIAIGSVKHHQSKSHYFLNRAFVHIVFNRPDEAANSLRRSASHAATACAVHWHRRYQSRRYLTTALTCVIFDCGIPRSHLRTFQEVYAVKPAWLRRLSPRNIYLALARMHRRVRRLVIDVDHAIAAHPDPPTIEQVMARLAAEPKPEPPPPPTIGEYRRALGQWVNPEYADHPYNCPGCRTGYHDPTPAPSPS